MAYQIGIIGNGWRTQTFLQVIDQLPSLFQLKGMYFRNAEKAAAFDKQRPGVAFTDKQAFYAQQYDFVVIVLPRSVVLSACEEAYQHGVPVLCETPPCDGVDQLAQAWALKQQYNAKVQVLEQYFRQPYHQALIELAQGGALGTVTNVNLSLIHDYHGISVMRKLLGVGGECCQIDGKAFNFPVTNTCGRGGMQDDGALTDNPRKRATFSFESGKVGFHDFAGGQYFNYLNTRHLNLQGTRGEVYDYDICTLDEHNHPVQGHICRQDLGQWSNLEGYCLRSLQLNGKEIFVNPYQTGRLTDDEIGIAQIFEGMGRYANGGADIYPLAEALQDTYLYLMMDQAIQTNTTVHTTAQLWADQLA